MTKCERTYELARLLDAALLEQIGAMHSIVGIQKLRPSAKLDAITVGWDAARLSIPQLESLLAQHGFPLKPFVPPPPPVKPEPPAEAKA
jgi:hypothetical protein